MADVPCMLIINIDSSDAARLTIVGADSIQCELEVLTGLTVRMRWSIPNARKSAR